MNGFLKHIAVLMTIMTMGYMVIAQSNSDREKIENIEEKTRILFIVDCSNNMYEKWQSNTKIKITKSLLSNIVDSLSNYPNVEMALRTYGNESSYQEDNCDDTHLLVPFYRLNGDNIKSKLKALVPKGTSPVAKSLEKAAEDFPNDKNCRNIVIMIVDNIDKCDGDAALVSTTMQKKGKYIKPFIIGISKGMKSTYSNCGNYYEAIGEIEFSKVLNTTIKQAIHSTTLQVNLLDSYMETTESDVVMNFFDAQSGQLRYSFVHTFNRNGISDTLFVDPLVRYNIVIGTIPEVKKENVAIKAGTHSIVPISTPQGSMSIRYVNGSKTFEPKIYPVIVKKAGEKETINVQYFNTKQKYLVGKYDLEVLSLPPFVVNDVEVSQSSLTTIEIPEYGTLRIEKQSSDLIGGIYSKVNGDYRWVKNLEKGKVKETLQIMPGEYFIVCKSPLSKKSSETIIQEIKIESNKTTDVVLQNKKP